MDIDLDDVTLHVRDTGSGVPVVLLHGWPDTGDLWQHQVQHPAAGIEWSPRTARIRQVQQADRPGRLRPAAMVGDVIGVLDALDIESAPTSSATTGALPSPG